MQPPKQNWEQNPLRKLAEQSLKTPGMYLIALRSHVCRGQTMIGDMLESVADALPKPAKLPSPKES